MTNSRLRSIQSLLAARESMAKSRPVTAAVAGRDAAKLPRLPGEIVLIIMEPILEQGKLEKIELKEKAF